MVLVVVLIVIGGIFFTITLSYHQHIWLTVTHKTHEAQALWLAESGLKRVEYFLNGGDGKGLDWECESFKEVLPDYGTIELSNRRFGMYNFTNVTGTRVKASKSLDALLYRVKPNELIPLITLTGHIGGMVIDNVTELSGDVVIHHGSVKRGKYKRTIPGSESWTITKEMPALPFEMEEFASRFKQPAELLSRVYTVEKENKTLSPTSNDTLLVHGTLHLAAGIYENCVIISSEKCTMAPNITFKNCQLITVGALDVTGISSQSLFFAEGAITLKGTHESQFLSTESISVEEGTYKELSLFSVWETQRDSTLDTIPLFSSSVMKGLEGSIITVVDSQTVRDAGVLAPESSFKGNLITNGSVRVKECNFNGSLWCHSVLSEVDNVLYKNWLWGCTFTPGKRATPFPLIGTKPLTVMQRSAS